MKVKLHKLSLGLATSLMLFSALPAYAINKYGCIYSVDSWGHTVKDSYNRCVRTPWWTPDKEISECGGIKAAEQPSAIQCEKITIGTDTLFDFNSVDLKTNGRSRLDQLASDINRAERVSNVKIVGHTDARGTDAYNMRLGQRRADTVASYLSSRNIPSSKLTTSSMGESQPIAPNTLSNGKDNSEGRAQNRRVEITTVTEMCRE